ncbi:hypothetical protein J5Y04_39220 [Kitasatospora sp. RG8]|uniref:hypothetical protein n=1 Tax=Kitasatospora sp. RG8 TaxID=2820815 RepID=UPI001AE01038|nr:hypothetical protein [Kitasatospora sp. RG8]MBP0455510.1 hypothetical protein [Kitasatospora sp. RG8]
MADDRGGPGSTNGPRPGGPHRDGLKPGGPHPGGPNRDGLSRDGLGRDGLSAEERRIRELMQRAVSEVQPDPAGLHRIRHAVPRRRAAVRGAWTGAAALALAVAIALPALHDDDHLGLSGGPGSPGAHGGTASAPVGGTKSGDDPVGPNQSPHSGTSGTGTSGGPSGSASAPPSPGATTAGTGPGLPAPTTASSSGGEVLVPLCTRGDLGQGTAQTGRADAAGRIYGYFTVLNVSGRACRLGGPGAVSVVAVTGTDAGRIRVSDHTAGDPATGLPAPGAGAAAGGSVGGSLGGAVGGDGAGQGLLLAPQAGYRVDFGWVPDAGGCPAPGGPTPSATAGPGGPAVAAGPAPGATSGAQAAATGGSGGAAPAAASSEAPSAAPPASATPTTVPTTVPSPTITPSSGPSSPPPAVTIAHTPAPGSPSTATAVLPGACAGTVYRTAPQPLTPPPAPTPTTAPSAG